MSRGGQKKTSEAPERKCIVSGVIADKAVLIRFVLAPAGEDGVSLLAPDIMGRLPGRGIYVAPNRAALEKAVQKNLFTRAARQQIKLPDGLVDMIEAQLLRRVVDLLALARKSGGAICGFEKVKDWLIKGQAAMLLQASDGSARGREKLRPPRGENTLISCLTAYELGLAFGREHAIHAALAAGGLCDRIKHEVVRLGALRGATDQQVGDMIAGKDTKDV